MASSCVVRSGSDTNKGTHKHTHPAGSAGSSSVEVPKNNTNRTSNIQFNCCNTIVRDHNAMDAFGIVFI